MQTASRPSRWAPEVARFHYERHRPEQTTLYRLVQQHAATFFAEVEAATCAGLPQFAKDEFDAFLLTPLLQVVHRVLTRFLLEQAGLKAAEADSSAVTLIQRFGSAANLNNHLHCLVLDGVYRRSEAGPVFVEVPAPTDEALQAVLHKIITRRMKLLTRRGALVEEQGSTYLADRDADSDDARTLRPLEAAACTDGIAFGPRAGQKVLTVPGVMPRDADVERALCANRQGLSLHAAVRSGADERKSLEQLCRYVSAMLGSEKTLSSSPIGNPSSRHRGEIRTSRLGSFIVWSRLAYDTRLGAHDEHAE